MCAGVPDAEQFAASALGLASRAPQNLTVWGPAEWRFRPYTRTGRVTKRSGFHEASNAFQTDYPEKELAAAGYPLRRARSRVDYR